MRFYAGVGILFAIGCGSVSGHPEDANTGSDTTNAITHALIVTKTGTGAGTVTSDVSGISCGADCNEQIAEGTNVTLTPTPDAGSVFVKWMGGCTGSGTCSVTVTADTSVIAQFSPGAALNFPVAGDNRVTVSPNGDFNSDGDFVSGSRATSGLSQATYARIHLVLEHNSLLGAACTGTQKTQDATITLRKMGGQTTTLLGIIPISAGQTFVDAEFTFAAVMGPSFDIEYITYTNVASGCGGSGYSNTGSTIMLVNQ